MLCVVHCVVHSDHCGVEADCISAGVAVFPGMGRWFADVMTCVSELASLTQYGVSDCR